MFPTKIDINLLRPHALVKEASCKEAGLTDQELQDLSEEIRYIIMGDRGLSLPEYIEACKKISHLKFGYRKLKVIHNEPKLSAFFPDEVLEVLKTKGLDRRVIYFDRSDDEFIAKNAQKGVAWLGKRFYCKISRIYKHADKRGIHIPRTYVAYTQKEDDFIKKNVSMGFNWIGEKIGRSYEAIRCRAKKLGIISKYNAHIYTPEDDKFIREHLHRGSAYIASQLHVSIVSLRGRAYALNIRIPYINQYGTFVKKFTQKEDQFIKENADKGYNFLAKKLHRNFRSVLLRCRKLNVKVKQFRHTYTEKDDSIILRLYHKGMNYLSRRIGVSSAAIKKRAKRLGLDIVAKMKECKT